MNKTVIKTPRSLAKLTPMIRKELKAGFQAGERHWKTVGRLLNEARENFTKKGLPKSGKGPTWGEWVSQEFIHPWTNDPLNIDTARKWMRAVNNNGRSRPSLSIRAATDTRSPDHPDHNPKLDWQAGVRKVQKTVNVDQLRKQLATEREQARERDALARKIVDAGFRALSAVVHPDRPGGSKEAMKKLTETKNWLQEQIRRGS